MRPGPPDKGIPDELPEQAVYVGVSLDGSVVNQDADDDEALYGCKVIAKQTLIDGTVGTPEAARDLDRTLEKYSPKGGQAFNGSICYKIVPRESE